VRVPSGGVAGDGSYTKYWR